MQTVIYFIDGESLSLDDTATVKTTDHGLEVVQPAEDGDGSVRILYPWARIEKVVQTGIGVGSVYTY